MQVVHKRQKLCDICFVYGEYIFLGADCQFYHLGLHWQPKIFVQKSSQRSSTASNAIQSITELCNNWLGISTAHLY